MPATTRKILAFALVLSAPSALVAHHGWSGALPRQFELTGVVVEPVRLAGPHATMRIRAQDQLWDVTLAPPERTRRAGLLEDTLAAGAEVTVSGHRNADPKRFEVKTERVTHAGRVYNVYPDRD